MRPLVVSCSGNYFTLSKILWGYRIKKGKFIWGPANDLERSQLYSGFPVPHVRNTFSQPSAHTWANPPSFQVFSQALLGIGHFSIGFTTLSWSCSAHTSVPPHPHSAQQVSAVSNLKPLDALIWVLEVVGVFHHLATEEWVAKAS